jgi:L-alanine-DL-glutamate epimerase-like enolase superfamily enzyme
MERLNKTFGNPFAKAGIEMALFDLLGKSLGMRRSINSWRGSCAGRRYRCGSRSCRWGRNSPPKSRGKMAAEGFRTIKLKVGHDPLDYDLKRVRLVRDAVGEEVRLTVDANGGWSVNEAIRAAPQLEELGVAFIEQPVHRSDLDGMARVRRAVRLPIMADEAVFTVQDALACLQKEAADIISVYPGKNGGLLNTLTIVRMAEAAGVQCAIGSNLEWDISSAAMIHATAALRNIDVERYAADIIGPIFHVEHACSPSLLGSPGHVVIPEGPGLGVTLDPAVLAPLQV